MDRIKENLFNILGAAYVEDASWLDLFAGTGQVGIEALSRGAAAVVFLDNTRPAVRTIQQNLALTDLGEAADVHLGDAFAYLQSAHRRFDVIFVAPPQYQGLWLQALQAIDKRADSLLVEDGVVVVQIDPREAEDPSLQALTLRDERRYGNTLLRFYEPAADTPSGDS